MSEGQKGQKGQKGLLTGQDKRDTPKGECPLCPVGRELAIYLEPQQEREVTAMLREATLSGRGVLADLVRTPHGVKLSLGTFGQKAWGKMRKIIEEENP